ncbi:hypothetical protein GCM10010206_28070 [Streptomyces cinerochromogenes]|nr:hypothetical protein GCM10010206_28070 [Streptomyces cinerochromogenes]
MRGPSGGTRERSSVAVRLHARVGVAGRGVRHTLGRHMDRLGRTTPVRLLRSCGTRTARHLRLDSL